MTSGSSVCLVIMESPSPKQLDASPTLSPFTGMYIQARLYRSIYYTRTNTGRTL